MYYKELITKCECAEIILDYYIWHIAVVTDV